MATETDFAGALKGLVAQTLGASREGGGLADLGREVGARLNRALAGLSS